MKWMLGLMCASALTGAAFAASWETSSVRTANGGLVRIGMTANEVLKELGEPPRPRASNGAGGKSGTRRETWTYRGTDGLYAIEFAGGKVVRIEVTPDRD